jgi:hypothetical protein
LRPAWRYTAKPYLKKTKQTEKPHTEKLRKRVYFSFTGPQVVLSPCKKLLGAEVINSKNKACRSWQEPKCRLLQTLQPFHTGPLHHPHAGEEAKAQNLNFCHKQQVADGALKSRGMGNTHLLL